ncbi:putative Ovochymase-2 [Hypsibius exemplaris]|uniref:Ovochymase-2 n=1 Tax=Hypsibius exemplaris TaxID=2072580 RepID=A0A1W0WSK2_HYPEX|nr:putative Ovochymase-2 [Hypsibius exemplaris]
MAYLYAVLCLAFVYGVSGQCTTPAFLTGASGVVASANPYLNNQKCRWTITVAAGNRIDLTFGGRFDIENSQGCQYDALHIYDTQSVAAVTRNQVCSQQSLTLPGHKGPFCGFTKPRPLVSTGNQVVIEFCTDTSSTATGFDIQYSTNGAVVATTRAPTVATVCNENVVVDGRHTVTYYSNTELPNYLDCKYSYRSKSGRPLKVTATRFSLEGVLGCRYDSLKVYDGPNATVALIGTFCGTNGPSSVRTTGSNLYMTLTSDEYTNGKGISLEIEESCTGTHLCSAKNEAGQDVCYSDAQTCDNTNQCPDRQDESFCAQDCGAFPNWVAGQPFPGAAAITNIDGQIHCGGALINKNYVLTTAHCFHRLDDKPNRFVVKLGASVLADAYVSQIERIIVHPQFNPKNLVNNLALIKLSRPAPVQTTIAPFCYPTADATQTPPANTVCYTLGWGRTSPTNINSYASTVKQFTATVQPLASCRTGAYTSSPVVVDDNSICARTSGALCYGDNGAPLVCRAADGKWHVSGINSVAFSCTLTGSAAQLPSAFVRVDAHNAWVRATAFESSA